MATGRSRGEVLCALGLHADVPRGADAVCTRCGCFVARWTDADLADDTAFAAAGSPPCPASLRVSRADGGFFFAFSYAPARRVGRYGAGVALTAAVAVWALSGDPRAAARLGSLGVIVFGVYLVYRGLLDAFAQVVVHLDARALDVRRAPRLLPDERLDMERVTSFAADTVMDGGAPAKAAKAARNVVLALTTDDGAVVLHGLRVASHAEAAYVAYRLTEALLTIRRRCRGDEAPRSLAMGGTKAH